MFEHGYFLAVPSTNKKGWTNRFSWLRDNVGEGNYKIKEMHDGAGHLCIAYF